MRRSAAPSQQRFRAQFRSPEQVSFVPAANIPAPTTHLHVAAARQESRFDTTSSVEESNHPVGMGISPPLPDDGTISANSDNKLPIFNRKRPRFTPPISAGEVSRVDTKADVTPDPTTETTTYWNAVWTKASNKKHKTWDDDAVVILLPQPPPSLHPSLLFDSRVFPPIV